MKYFQNKFCLAKDSNKIALVSFFLILIVNSVVYYPSLSHGPRADHETFLAEVADKDGIFELIRYTYSFDRTRKIFSGESLVYRPLQWVVMSVEKGIFGYNYYLWQLMGLILHGLILWVLWRILNHIAPHILSFFFVCCFSVLAFSQEMVIWHHMHSYMLCILFILLAYYKFTNFIDGENKREGYLWSTAIFLLIASLLNEIGAIGNLVLILLLFVDKVSHWKNPEERWYGPEQKRKTYLILALPLVIFTLLNVTDYLLRLGAMELTPLRSIEFRNTAYYFLLSVWICILSPIVPTFLQFWLDSRLKIKSYTLTDLFDNFAFNDWANVLNGILIVLSCLLALYVTVLSLKKFLFKVFENDQENKSLHGKSGHFLGVVCLLFALGFNLIIVLVRVGTYGSEHLKGNLYYFYIIVLFLSIFFYYLLARIGLLTRRLYSKGLLLILSCLCLSTLLNGIKSYQTNVQIKEQLKTTLVYRKQLGEKNHYISRKHAEFAFQYVDKKQYPLALIEIEKALEINANNIKAHNLKGIVHRALGQEDLALQSFQNVLLINPYHEWAYNNIGLIYENNGFHEEAIKAYTQAIILNPTRERIFANRGAAYLSLKKLDLALADFNKALELNPYFVEAFTNRGVLYYEQKKFRLAIKELNQALKLDPTSSGTYLNRGVMYEAMGDIVLALADYGKAIELDQEFEDAYNNRCYLKKQLGRYEEALIDCQKALSLDPEHVDALNNRGSVYFHLKQYNLALEDYNKVISLRSDYVLAYNNRGLLWRVLDKRDLALKDYVRAIELKPNNLRYRFNRAMTYFELKQHDAAIKELSYVLDADPEHAEAYFYRSQLYEIKQDNQKSLADALKAKSLGVNIPDDYFSNLR